MPLYSTPLLLVKCHAVRARVCGLALPPAKFTGRCRKPREPGPQEVQVPPRGRLDAAADRIPEI